MAYREGSAIRCSAAFTDSAGAAVDPTAVYFSYKNPAGTVVTLTYGVDVAVVKDSTGNYHVDLTALAVFGDYTYRWHSTGNGQAANEDSFELVESEVI